MKYLLIILLIPIFSCSQQDYQKKPYNEYEEILRNSSINKVKNNILFITADWEKMDSLSFLRHKNIKHILIKEDVSQLPTWISQFENLETLDTYYAFPDNITNLKNLKHLNVQNLKSNIPIDICELKELRYLILNGENINEFPECMENLNKIETLAINSPSITEFPKFLLKYYNLKELDLSGTSISEIPEDISVLKGLEIFDFSNTKIKSLPTSFFNLKSVRQVYFNETHLDDSTKEKIHLLLKQNQ